MLDDTYKLEKCVKISLLYLEARISNLYLLGLGCIHTQCVLIKQTLCILLIEMSFYSTRYSTRCHVQSRVLSCLLYLTIVNRYFAHSNCQGRV